MEMTLIPALPVVVLFFLGLFLFVTDMCMSLLRAALTRSDLLPAFLQFNTSPEKETPVKKPLVETSDNEFDAALIDNVNHEIRTPLAGIMATAQILHEVVAPGHQEFTSMLMESSKRMNNAISNVVEFVALDKGSYHVDAISISLQQEIEDLILPHQKEARAKGIQLNVGPINGEFVLKTDPQLLRKVLNHLLNNAIKFTEHGSVRVSVKKENDWMHVVIKDTGIGISKAFLPDIYKPFWQASQGLTREYNGQGLGLALTRRMINLAGGKISIQSTTGSGSTFTVSYPRND